LELLDGLGSVVGAVEVLDVGLERVGIALVAGGGGDGGREDGREQRMEHELAHGRPRSAHSNPLCSVLRGALRPPNCTKDRRCGPSCNWGERPRLPLAGLAAASGGHAGRLLGAATTALLLVLLGRRLALAQGSVLDDDGD